MYGLKAGINNDIKEFHVSLPHKLLKTSCPILYCSVQTRQDEFEQKRVYKYIVLFQTIEFSKL